MKSELIVARQFTPVYDEFEDRIRLIVNINYPNRYDFWITRAFLIKILDRIRDFIDIDGISEDKSQNSSTDSSTDSLLKQPIYPFEREIQLLSTIQFSKKEEGIEIVLSDHTVSVKCILQKNELKLLIEAIVRQIQYRWGLFI